MSILALNRILYAGLVLFIGTGALVAIYEGASWAHRRPGLSWWGTFRPDRLFKPEFYTPDGDRLRRKAVRFLIITAILGLLLAVGLLYRNAIEARALAV